MLDLRLAVTDQLPTDSEYVRVQCLNKAAHKNGDQTPAMAVYHDGLYCFACGFRSTGTKALAGLLGKDLEDIDVAQYQNGNLKPSTREPEEVLEPLPLGHADLYHQWLTEYQPDKLDWLHDRGFTDQTIKAFCFGYNGINHVIPVFLENGSLITFRYRMDPDVATEAELKRHKYLGLKGRNGHFLYPAWRLEEVEDWCVVVEGEYDTAVLWQDGIPAFTLTNGAGQLKRLPAMLPERIKRVYILADNDEAGQEAQEKVIAECLIRDIVPIPLAFPEGINDTTEAYQAGWRFPREVLCTATTLATK